jgi:hypothetical protein
MDVSSASQSLRPGDSPDQPFRTLLHDSLRYWELRRIFYNLALPATPRPRADRKCFLLRRLFRRPSHAVLLVESTVDPRPVGALGSGNSFRNTL